MKNKLTLVLFGFLLLAYSSFGQHYQNMITLDERINLSEIIVEGEVIEKESYYNELDDKIYTINRIKIYKQFKGDYLADEINLVTLGGQYDDMILKVFHSFQVGKGTKGVFFLNENSEKHQLQTFEAISEGLIRYSYLEGVDYLVANSAYEDFDNIEVNLLQEIERKVGKKRTVKNLTQEEQKLNDWLNNQPIDKNGNSIENIVEYTIANPSLTGAFNEYLEFDINIASLLTNEEFFSGELLIDYNTLTFGSSLASSGILTITKGNVILTPNYTITVTDLTPSQLKIEVKSSSNNPNTLYLIDNTADQLIHLKIDITNLAGNTGIDFDEINMQGVSEFFDISTSIVEPFDLVKADDELEIEFNNFAAPILLDSITPTPYRSGATSYRGGYDTLYLHGKHFGSDIQTVNGWVEFQNAHGISAGAYMKPLKKDYILWSDSLIIVKVPSIGIDISGTATNIDQNYAGTGIVKVYSLGLYSLPQNIQIPFSIMNWRPNASFPSFPYTLINRNGIGGYTLTYTPSFSNFPNTNSSGSFTPVQVFEKALIQWRCATGLNFIINDSIPNLQWENPSNTNANQMIVGFDPAVSSLARTEILFREICDTNYLNQSSARYYVEKFSILFSPTTSWWFDEDTTTFLAAAPQYDDFISAALHELGHAHLLNHSKNFLFGSYETMYWTQPPGFLVRQIDINSDMGGNFMSDFSINTSPSNCFSPMIKTQSVFCDIVDRTNEHKYQKLEVSIFPNPVNDNLNLEFSEIPNSNIQLTLYDLVGRRILSNEFSPNENLKIDISDLAKGTYFIEIKIGNSSTTQKIIKF